MTPQQPPQPTPATVSADRLTILEDGAARAMAYNAEWPDHDPAPVTIDATDLAALCATARAYLALRAELARVTALVTAARVYAEGKRGLARLDEKASVWGLSQAEHTQRDAFRQQLFDGRDALSAAALALASERAAGSGEAT